VKELRLENSATSTMHGFSIIPRFIESARKSHWLLSVTRRKYLLATSKDDHRRGKIGSTLG